MYCSFWKPLLVLLVIVAIPTQPGVSFAQINANLIFERIPTAQGLPRFAVTAIIQDKIGFLWVGTKDGLYRHDGYTFTAFTHNPNNANSLSDSYINIGALFEDQAGYLWIGTNHGLNRLDLKTEKVTRFLHDPDDPASISHNNVLAIHETRSGELWIGTERGLNRYDSRQDRFTRFLNDPDDDHSLSTNLVNALCEDLTGKLWVGTMRGLHALDRTSGDGTQDARFTRYRSTPEASNRMPHEFVMACHVDRAGHLAIGTWGGGLLQFGPISRRFTQHTHVPADLTALPNNYVVAVHEDQAGHLWVGTWGGGLSTLDPATRQFHSYTSDTNNPQRLLDARLFSVYEDRTGVLWVGTEGGLNKVPPRKKFVHHTEHPDDPLRLTHGDVSAICEDRDDTLWVGTHGGGLQQIGPAAGQGQRFRTDAGRRTGLSSDDVSSIACDDADALWVGTIGGGLNRYDRARRPFTHYRHTRQDPHSLSSDDIYSVYKDRTGDLWIGTATGGLNKLDEATGRFIRYRHDPADSTTLSYDAVWPIYEDHTGVLWVGTISGGLNRFHRDTERFTRYQHDPQDPYSISSDRILFITEDRRGALWIGTMGGGLNRFDRETGRFHRYAESEGVPFRNIACILSDEAGHLWLSTNEGLAKVDIQTANLTRYNAAKGLPEMPFNAGSCLHSARGNMYFGNMNGLVVFRPDDIWENQQEPPVVITGIELFNEPLPLDSSAHSIRHLTLSHKKNFIAFRFATLDFAAPLHNEYAYKLEGLDEDWVFANNRRYAGYPNLAPGHYTFRVKGANSDGIWNKDGSSVLVIITPPFWQNWWFQGLIIALFVVMLTVAYKFRVHHLLQVERTRQRIAEDLHDDISIKVSAIALGLDAVEQTGRLQASEQKRLRTIAQNARRLVKDLRDTIWIVDIEEDRLDRLVERMEKAAREMPEKRNVHFKAPRAVAPVPVKMEQRRDLFLLYKEALHNAARHAEASRINVNVDYTDQTLSVCVADDGVGFDPAEVNGKRGRKGLVNMEKRRERLDGQLEIRSRQGHGTTVRFSMKIA